jgi:hypothetical protein
MCNLYCITKGQKPIRDLANAVVAKASNMPSLAKVYFKRMAPVVQTNPNGHLTVTVLR